MRDMALTPESVIEPAPPVEREVRLAVEGIHCASCVQLIEMSVGGLPGVVSADASLATHRMRVRWAGDATSLADIVATIARAGYKAWPLSAGGAALARTSAQRMALWRLFVAGFSMMQVMMVATPAYLAIEGEMAPDIDQLLRIASFVLTVPVIGFSAAPLFAGAWRDLMRRRIGMDVPASLGLAVTFGASVWATFVSGGPVYFDSVSMFVFFLLGGRHLEALARRRAVAAVEELARIAPARAARLAAWPGSDAAEDVAAADLRAGDHVLVRSGAATPADGVVMAGNGLHDEALLTGEARPVPKAPGNPVIGGAINLGQPLIVRVTAAGAESRLSQVLRLAESAAQAKPLSVQLADRHAAHFLWAILAVSATAALVWLAFDPARALPAAVAVLIVTCPCALSLAAPIAQSAAIGNLARRGVLVMRAHALETLARATNFVFDKTGTLTTGRMRVERIVPLGALDGDSLLLLAGRMETEAVHPAAQALAMQAAPLMRKARAAPPTCRRETQGAGVEAMVDGETCRIGSVAFAQGLHGQPLPDDARGKAGSGTLAALANQRGWLGLFVLGDGLRADVRGMAAAIGESGASLALATGDNRAAADTVAAQAGIAEVRAGMSAADKRRYVQALQDAGAVVAMVGDGINDAPVLAQANVGIAMGGGAPLTQTRADMVLMSARPADLAHAIRVARRMVAVVRQNLLWAGAYNLVAIPLAASGMLTPWMAGLGMSASSLIVVLNSLRLAPRRQRVAAPATPAPMTLVST